MDREGVDSISHIHLVVLNGKVLENSYTLQQSGLQHGSVLLLLEGSQGMSNNYYLYTFCIKFEKF